MSQESKGVKPLVSVVIPVYNDAEPLKTCLQALGEQTYPREHFEVVVVDNNSEEDIASVVAQFECATIVHESKQGSYAARNKGIREADGDVIAFTDADCIPKKTWIERGVGRLTEDDACGVVGGCIKFTFQDPNRPSPPELFDATHYLNQSQYVTQGKFAATANAFTWKRLFDEVGLFDVTLRSGGDTEWGRRVYRQGGKICYADAARVRHPARHTYAALRRKKLRVVEGTVQTRKQQGYPLWNLVFDIVKDVGHHVKYGVAMAIEEPYNWKERIELLGAFSYQGILTAGKRVRSWIGPTRDARQKPQMT